MTTITFIDAPAPRPTPKAFAVSAIVAACSLLWMASENHYAQCIAGQHAAATHAAPEGTTAQLRDAAAGGGGGCKRYLVI